MRTLSEHTCLCKSDSDRAPDRQSAITACRVPAPSLISNASNANGAQRNARPVNARALRHCLPRTHGLASSLYTDRGSHYFTTPEAGGKVDKVHITQVGGALAHLGIEHIAAYSPEARGRSERMFGTLQGRLPKDLRLAGIKTVEAANAWLKAHYMSEHNAAFAIKAEQQGTAFVADRHQAWREALCVIEERTVANDNTIAWSGQRLQLPPSRLRPHFVKALVRVHAYPDGTVSVFLGPHRLATFAADGQQISPDAPQHGSVLGALKDKPLRARKRASLTAPARAAVEIARVGAEKRASSRTKKPTRTANPSAKSMA